MLFLTICLVGCIYFGHSQNVFKYDGYKVYQVIPKTLTEAILLHELEDDKNFDFWSELLSLNKPVDIMVSPIAQDRFEASLKSENMVYSTVINNVEEKIQEENVRQLRATRSSTGNVSFVEYMRHDDILAYLNLLVATYPNIVKTEVIGKSFEGRNLTMIKISSGGSNKPIIFIEAAIHAREWIATPVALYIINQLVENSENADMYQDVDWVVLPVVNPDGYEYTHTNERLWRKTRTPGTICDGVDGNRNFDYQWMVIGASSWQCTQTYAGFSPLSETEVRTIGNFFLANKGKIKLFIDLHSYGQLLMYPWGYSTDSPENVAELQSLGERVNDAISAVRGVNYTVGNANEVLYATSGGSRDYAKAVGGVNLSYTIELPAGGTAGFNPPASAIVPIVIEIWDGIKIFYQHIKANYTN